MLDLPACVITGSCNVGFVEWSGPGKTIAATLSEDASTQGRATTPSKRMGRQISVQMHSMRA
jgi:hypothetical protein